MHTSTSQARLQPSRLWPLSAIAAGDRLAPVRHGQVGRRPDKPSLLVHGCVLLPALCCTMHHTMERSTPLCQPGPTIHRAVQVPDRNYFLIAANEAERNEWVAGIGARLRALRVPRPVARLGVSVARALAGRVQA